MKLNEVNQDNLHDYIYKTKWTSEWGMIDSEIQPLIKHLQGKYVWNEDKYIKEASALYKSDTGETF